MFYYVCILLLKNGKHYYGCTSNVDERFKRHLNGKVISMKQLLPAKLIWYCAFPDRYKAYYFEKHLKSGSGRAFSFKHLF